MDYNQLSCIEIVIKLLEEKGEPANIVELIQEALRLKGINDTDGMQTTRLYADITTSSKFVFCGEGKWDLKQNQSLDVFDRDGSYFGINIENEDDEDEDIDLSDYNIDDDDDDEEDEERDVEDVELYDEEEDEEELLPLEEDEDDDSYIDEDKYNALMDDYEDMYDKD